VLRSAIITDSPALAKLHSETLTASFLAGLGLDFLEKLYEFLIKKEKVWVYEEDHEIKGFISFSENSAGMMKRFLLECPGCIVLLASKTIIQPANLKRLMEIFLAPFKSRKLELANDSVYLPKGELLSISVKPNCQASGIGSQLIKALEDYLLLNHIPDYKVVAGEELIGANKFYKKNGFVLATQIKIHDKKISNVYAKYLETV
jgi:ribosomal protein S18 acetylase RimI-like enzyme